MKDRTVLEITIAVRKYAADHGAIYDPILKQWYVVGDVPAELVEFVPKRVRQVVNEIIPSCPRCGAQMERRFRKADGDAFWGCSNFPACRNTMPWVYSNVDTVSSLSDPIGAQNSGAGEKGCTNQVVSLLAVRREKIVILAAEKTGGAQNAERWLTTPKVGLGGRKPTDVMGSEEGCERVEQILSSLS